MSAISAITPSDNAADADAVRRSTNATSGARSNGTLGQDEFFSLITTQMANQNPLEPLKDTDFIAQMATFSSLEQMQQLNETMSDYRQESVAIAAAAYLDKEVTVADVEEDITGIVTQVKSNAEGTFVVVDGKTYPVDDVRAVHSVDPLAQP